MKPTPEILSPMFDRAAARYDRLNSLMSLGRDASWRDALAAGIRRGDRVLDLCCGSARSSLAVTRRSGRAVIGVDVSPAMLALGATHAAASGAAFSPVHADAFRLPFADGAFDAVTVAWGLRNLKPERQALREMRRVLRAGGGLHVLDSPSPPAGPLGAVHRFYVRRIVPALGRLSDDPAAYRYLSSSILDFCRVEDVARRLEEAGFRLESTRRLFLGAAAVWRAVKPVAAEAPLQPATNGAAAGQSACLAAPVP